MCVYIVYIIFVFHLWFQAKQQAHMRAHIADECKNDYAAQLQKYNKEQSQFYFNDMPLIFNVSELPVTAW